MKIKYLMIFALFSFLLYSAYCINKIKHLEKNILFQKKVYLDQNKKIEKLNFAIENFFDVTTIKTDKQIFVGLYIPESGCKSCIHNCINIFKYQIKSKNKRIYSLGNLSEVYKSEQIDNKNIVTVSEDKEFSSFSPYFFISIKGKFFMKYYPTYKNNLEDQNYINFITSGRLN